MHHTKIITVYIVGAGTRLGNGGDNFDWVDAWHVERPGNKVGNFDSIVLEKESSASARVMFVHGKYRWKQLGD